MQVTRDTPLSVGFITWQFTPPETRLVVTVKATFTFVPDGICALAEEQQLCTGDLPHEEDETQSLRYPSDIVPMKPHGECILAGTCHPPGGRATISAVGFRVGRAHREIAVFGDREWSGRLAAGVPTPKPFESMPLRWERSFGGRGHDRNPFGRGLVDVETPAGAVRPLPNLEDPTDLVDGRGARPRPAGMFPLPAEWRAKDSRLGTYDRAYMRDRWPYLPADFDYAYFHAAPRDLRIEGFWSGDEEIELKNLHPSRPVMRSRLPGTRPRAFLSHVARGLSRFEEVPLHLDTITVDADAMLVFCVWRGAQPVASETLADIEHLFVAHEVYGQERPLPVYAERLAEILRTRDEELAELEGAAPEAAEVEAPRDDGAPPSPEPEDPVA
ncbi:MAG: DUF2169 domain-containing protein, partial [Deltaproteobacteria bacterium]|nr:DUF2169 domain-containing protein [Deltaproteobacteria bacterium]